MPVRVNKLITLIIAAIILVIGIGVYLIFQRLVFAELEISSPTAIKLIFLKEVDIENSARPEIVATKDRVFVVYLGDIPNDMGPPPPPINNKRQFGLQKEQTTPFKRTSFEGQVNRNMKGRTSFKVKIFDASLNEIATHTLVSSSQEYGMTTDIRIASDEQYIYAFYETADMRKGKSYLWGAKYSLTDNFQKVAYTPSPIAVSTTFNIAQEGDEKLDDPAPLIGPDSIFVVTRIKTSFKKEGRTLYRVREFSKNLEKLSEFDLDLSSVADGSSRQASLIYHNGYFYIAVPTTVANEVKIELDLAIPSDIVLVKLDENWKIAGSKVISCEPDDVETYITGFDTDGRYFYLTYNQLLFGREMSSPLKIYDKDFNLIFSKKIKSITPRKGLGLRPSLEVSQDKIFLGNDGGDRRSAKVYIYEVKK